MWLFVYPLRFPADLPDNAFFILLTTSGCQPHNCSCGPGRDEPSILHVAVPGVTLSLFLYFSIFLFFFFSFLFSMVSWLLIGFAAQDIASSLRLCGLRKPVVCLLSNLSAPIISSISGGSRSPFGFGQDTSLSAFHLQVARDGARLVSGGAGFPPLYIKLRQPEI
ncbi:TPA: hypothetical protein N2G38_003230 [Salmonella enterica]|nr:hypothetical protein [Salmonella enterica]